MTSVVELRAACPLCDAVEGSEIGTVRYDDVWARLERDFHVTIPSEVRRANTPADEIAIVRCGTCGLDRFDPPRAGDRAFYEALMSSVPYTAERWDFRVVSSAIEPDDDVADLGAGEGRFLGSLPVGDGRRIAVDHHAAAVERWGARGGEGFVGTFEAFGAAEAGRLDVVTSFHTLEHVPDPMSLLRAAARSLRPAGTCWLSVPNRDRTLREEGEPMDRPPHHVTRWSAAQVREAAGRAGLEVVSIRAEPPDLAMSRAIVRSAIARRVPAGRSRAVELPLVAISHALVPRARHRRNLARGRYAERGHVGQSLLAELRPRV